MIGLLTMAAVTQMTLGDLRTLCGDAQPIDACRYYVLGVAEGATLGAGVVNDRTHFCLPDDLSQMEMVEVVKRLAAADLVRFPQDANLAAPSFIGAALMKQYPCGR